MEGQSEGRCAGKEPGLIFPFMAPVYCVGKCVYWPLIRIVAGLWLVPHGSQKLFGWFGGKGMAATVEAFAGMGFSPALTYAAACTEFFGGLLIAFGLFTRFAAAGATILLLVATFAVHWKNGFFAGAGGFEYALMWAALCFAIFLRGGGPFSLDAKIGKEL